MKSALREEASPHDPVRSALAGLLLACLLFVPGALGFLYDASSFAPGTAISGALALGLAFIGLVPFSARRFQTALILSGSIAFVILAHLLLAVAVNSELEIDLPRAVLSILLMATIMVSIPAIREIVMPDDIDITLSVKIVFYLFVAAATFSILGIQPDTNSIGAKPTFPYTEPSFLGFSFTAVFIFTLVRSSLKFRVVYIVLFFMLAYALGNFTIVLSCVLAAAATLPMSWLAAGAAIAVAGSASLDLTYYTDRLDFDWSNSTNLSALVFVQGWQMLRESLQNSWGFGLGFQQLGIVYTNVPASLRINALLGRDANLQDGGFILSKFGSEFGIFGIALIVAYIYIAAMSLKKIRLATSAGIMSDAELLARSCVVGYFIEIFVRGTNYFTGTFALFLASLFYLAQRRSVQRLSAFIK